MRNLTKIKSTPIDVYSRIKNEKEAVFVRKTGMALPKFELLLGLIVAKIAEEKQENKMKMRGRKTGLTLSNQLLISLYYMRDYTIQLKLGDTFGISESYVCKIYNKMTKYMISVLNLPPKTSLKDMDLKQVIVDVTEQQIERPLTHQEDYYTGKKSFIP